MPDTLKNKHHVLITGSAGVIGQACVKEFLKRGHTVRGLDLKPTPLIGDFIVGPITDPAVVDKAVAGTTALVHLAATVDDADFLSELLPNNIVGLYHVMEAARRHGIKRVALASSMQVLGGLGHRTPGLIPPTIHEPWNGYAVTKLFAENLGQMYSVKHKMGVICARIGYLPRTAEAARPIKDKRWGRNVFCSHDDAGRFFACAIESSCPYAVLWCVSRRPDADGVDYTPGKAAIGWEPLDDYPQGLPFPL